MAENEISNEVREFVIEHITSMEQLEVLLLLSNHPEKEWTPESVFSEVQSSIASVSQRLLELSAKGLVARPRSLVYRYAPRTENLSNTVRALALTYKVRRIKVIELIYRKADEIQTFADAFKFRKDKPNG